MNVLIVDDDRFVVDSLRQKVNWRSLEIDQVYTAKNIRQAMKLFREHTIHILISDIEMPQGSGLELLGWIRSEEITVQAIFLTNFADFNYAQKAIELQSFEYYLKPIEFDKLELIIKKAAKKVKANQVKENEIKVGQLWHQNKEIVVEHFWYTFFKNQEPFSVDELQEQLKINNLDYLLDSYFFPLVVDLFPYQLVDNKEIISIFDVEGNFETQLKSIVAETFKDYPIRFDGLLNINKTKERYIAIFKLTDNETNISTKDLYSASMLLIEKINRKFKCDAQCSTGTISYFDTIQLTIQQLQTMNEEMINYRNKVFCLVSYAEKEKKYIEPNLELLMHFLQSGNRLSFINKCTQYLNNLLEKNALNHDVLCKFRLDITQIIYTYLKENNIHAHMLFQVKIASFLLEQSSRSINDIIIYITYLVDTSLDYIAYTNSQKSIVKTICDYIDQNYFENITRTSLAEIVYLSPDYLARIFKSKTGISLVNYIIKKRVEIAKDLLTNTDLPVHLISDKVGYGNYSYFTKLFKKETDCTPIEYRKKLHQTC
jgi:two-component system response regulator YesN